MAINKKLIHFQTLNNFEQLLSAGNILDTSICFIKDAKKIWTHGCFYDCVESYTKEELNSKQDIITDLETIRQGAAKGATSVQQGTLSTVATSGSYNDLTNKPTIPNAVGESTVSGWGFTKNVGTVTGVKVNGTTKNPSSGVVDLGAVITSHQDISGKQDKLVSGTNIKTINGTSILGSGDIIISGSGEGSSSYGNAYPQINHGTSDTTFTLTPNTFHVWDEITSLDLDLGEEIEGIANEYLFQFTSGSTATTLSLPSDLKWANNSAPTIESNMIYQVSILKGLASMLEFKNTTDFLVISSIYANDAKYAKVYEYFVNTYNLTSTSDSPSNGVIITETLTCDDPIVGGSVIKVSLNGTRLLLWTEKAINNVYVPAINNLGEYLNYMWD